jgi:hypothetical protein
MQSPVTADEHRWLAKESEIHLELSSGGRAVIDSTAGKLIFASGEEYHVQKDSAAEQET